jgi:peptidoglycan/xylan/chitin deacetylase (PgdA/CDA1 family)
MMEQWMSLRSIAATSFWSLLSTKTAQEALRLHYGGIASIFMLHRIRPARDLSALHRNRNMEITPDQLDELIVWAKATGYRIVSLRHIIDNFNTTPRYRECAFTFDDGYRDNLTHALPVFERHNAPFTVFVTTDFIDRKLRPWWCALEEAPITDKSMETLTLRILELPSRAEQELRGIGISVHDRTSRTDQIFLDWQQICYLSAHPLVEIGAHTVSHRRLSALEEQEVRREVRDCKRRIEEKIGKAVGFFAYPFGDAASCGIREFLIAEQSDYSASVTTRVGNICSGHRNLLHRLPRIPIEGVGFSVEKVALAVSGFPLLRQRIFRPIYQ